MAKRIGANERRRLESQKKFGVEKRREVYEKIKSQIKKIVLVFTFVAVCGMLGYGISKYKGALQFSVFDNKNIEWSGIEVPQFTVDLQVEKVDDLKGLFWMYKNGEWLLMDSMNVVLKNRFPTHKLPVVEFVEKDVQNKMVQFLKTMKNEHADVFGEVAQIQVRDDYWKVILESSTTSLKVHPEKKPIESIANFLKIEEKFFEEMVNVSEVDLRFPGYVFASHED